MTNNRQCYFSTNTKWLSENKQWVHVCLSSGLSSAITSLSESSLVSLSLQGQVPKSNKLTTADRCQEGKKVCNRILNKYEITDLKIPIERVSFRWKGSGFSIGNDLQVLSVTALTATPSCQKKDLSSKLPMLPVLIPHNWFCHVTLYLQKHFFSLHTPFSQGEFLVGWRGGITTQTSGSFLFSCPGATCLPQDMSQPRVSCMACNARADTKRWHFPWRK